MSVAIPPFSSIVAGIAERAEDRVTVGDISDAFGDRAFGALMAVFATPLALPMPPGVSFFLAAPLVLITFQLMIGRESLWLPRRLKEASVPRATFAQMQARLHPRFLWVERHIRPRAGVMFSPAMDRMIGVIGFLLALIAFLPIPFGNMLPGFALAAFGFGIAARDGVLIAIGWAASGAAVTLLIVVWKIALSALMKLFGLA